MSENDLPDDPVARNRATHPRRTPDRPQLGDDTLRTVMKVAAVAVGLATVILLLLLTACTPASDQLAAGGDTDGESMPPGSRVCADPVGDAAAMQGPGEPADEPPPPPHADLTEAALGLDDHTLYAAFTFAADTPDVGERTAYDDVMVMVTIYVDGRARYNLAADRDEEGAYAVAGTDLADVEQDEQGSEISFERRGYGIEGPTLTVSASRENLPGLEESFRWMAEVRARDTGSAEATPGTGAGGATASFDTCPNLTDLDAALLGGMGQPDGTTDPAPEDVLEKLPEGP